MGMLMLTDVDCGLWMLMLTELILWGCPGGADRRIGGVAVGAAGAVAGGGGGLGGGHLLPGEGRRLQGECHVLQGARNEGQSDRE
eukprot:1155056-Pyramimonas_sp.AAC.1